MKPYRLALTIPLIIAVLTGCSKQATLSGPTGAASQASADQAEVAAALAADPAFVNDEVSESPDQTSLESVAPASAARSASPAAAIRPITFWRQIRDIERRFEFAFADTDSTGRPTTAVVTVHRNMRGSFNLLVADEVPEGEPPQSHVVHKPLVDHAVRRILLKGRCDGTAPAPARELDPFLRRIAAGELDADELLGGYCARLFAALGSFEAVARRTRLDRRTVKRYAELGAARPGS